jgi:ubiquinone/menaquinone biosynthesis C-methylase UbiE
MESAEVTKLTELEDSHWWYAERRSILKRMIKGLPPTTALDIGAAGGGNTRALVDAGWKSVALEHSEAGAKVARDRGLEVVRADARALPFPDRSMGLVVAFDILEHVQEDDEMAAEVRRVLSPRGTALIAVPADMRLWGAHDVAVGHVRRYDRESLRRVLTDAGLVIEDMWSWNVLLRPVVKYRRRKSTGSDLEQLSPVTNAALRALIAAERRLPVRRLPGVSLVVQARSAG